MMQHHVRKRDTDSGANPANPRKPRATIDSPPIWHPHFRRVQVAISSLSDAEVGCIGRIGCSRPNIGHAAGGMVNWGGWGFDGQIR